MHIIDSERQSGTPKKQQSQPSTRRRGPQRQRSGQPPRSRASDPSASASEDDAGECPSGQEWIGGAFAMPQNAGHGPSQGVTQGANRDSTRNSSLVGRLSTDLSAAACSSTPCLASSACCRRPRTYPPSERRMRVRAGSITAGQLDDHIRRINQGFSVGGVQRGSAFQWRDALVSRTAIPINSTGAPMRFFKDGVILDQDASSRNRHYRAPSSATLIFSATIVSSTVCSGFAPVSLRPWHGCGRRARTNNHLSRGGDGVQPQVRLYSLNEGFPHSYEVNLSSVML